MKKSVLILLVSMFFATSLFAAIFPKSSLVVKTHDGKAFMVSVDDINFGEHRTFIMKDIRSGNHKITIKKVKRGRHGSKVIRIIYSGIVNIAPHSKTIATIDRHDKIFVEKVALKPVQTVHYGNVGVNCHSSGSVGVNSHGVAHVQTPRVMSPAEFIDLKILISHTAFNKDKMIVAKQAISSNKITVQQVREIMAMFSFESYKLEFAKFAYAHTIDKDKYFFVNNEFTFSSSITELNHYISTYYI